MRLATMMVFLMMVTAACSGDSDGDATNGTEGAGDGDDVVIEVTTLAYPTDTQVAAGGTVRWVNSSGAAHTVVFDTLDAEPATEADLDLPADGEATANLETGVWTYHCGIHPTMVGAVTVAG